MHTEYLNTPRLVADAAQQTVWRWDQQEPFGNNPADEDPDGNLVAFDLPLRLPGQSYDAETGLHYNYFRDYDPSIGRFGESDPVGLRGGINTYVYVAGAPMSRVDIRGLYRTDPTQFPSPNETYGGPMECPETGPCGVPPEVLLYIAATVAISTGVGALTPTLPVACRIIVTQLVKGIAKGLPDDAAPPPQFPEGPPPIIRPAPGLPKPPAGTKPSIPGPK